MSCRRCDETIDRLKAADWSRYEAELKYANGADYTRRLTIWMREQMTALRIRGNIPEPSDLERMYPNVPVTRPPQQPSAGPRAPATPG